MIVTFPDWKGGKRKVYHIPRYRHGNDIRTDIHCPSSSPGVLQERNNQEMVTLPKIKSGGHLIIGNLEDGNFSGIYDDCDDCCGSGFSSVPDRHHGKI